MGEALDGRVGSVYLHLVAKDVASDVILSERQAEALRDALLPRR
jgi:hypothetical protein